MPKPKTPTVNPTPTLNSVLRDAVVTALTEHLEQLSGSEPTNIYRLVLDEVERPMLELMMTQAGYNQQKAAKYLGINRATLRTKLKRHGLITDVTMQPLPTQQQQSNADTRSQAQKFREEHGLKSPNEIWDHATKAFYKNMDKTISGVHHSINGKWVEFKDGSIYRHPRWSM